MTARTIVCVFAAVFVVTPPVSAQDESALAAAFRRERETVAESCGELRLSALPGCLFTLATVNPLHVTFGSLAPENGVGIGPAFVWHPAAGETLETTWSADAVAAPGGAWRAGAYVQIVRTEFALPVVAPQAAPRSSSESDLNPVYSLYVQSISLDKLSFFGLGPSSDVARRSAWSMRQTSIGADTVHPVRRSGRLGLALSAGITGRFFRIGDGDTDEVPGISEIFGEEDAPGLGESRNYLEVAAGVRIAPTRWLRLRPSYSLYVMRFISGSERSFTRWTADLTHQVPFYETTTPAVRKGNTPNDCSVSLEDQKCPSPSRDRHGTLALRVVAVGSLAGSEAHVPFYLQPTLGGADIDNAKLLTGFADYRFRGPNALSAQLTFEHTLVTIPLPRGLALPLGGFLMAEQGAVASTFRCLSSFKRSYAAGVTIRAGGMPEVFLLTAWSPEGTRFSISISPGLLGASRRPPLQ